MGKQQGKLPSLEELGIKSDNKLPSLEELGLKKNLSTNVSESTSQPSNNGGLTDLSSLVSGGKQPFTKTPQPIDSEIPSVLTESGRKPYIQEQIVKKEKALQLSQDLEKYKEVYRQAQGTPLADVVNNIPITKEVLKQGQEEPSFLSKAVDAAGYIAGGFNKGLSNIAKGAVGMLVTGDVRDKVQQGISDVSEPFLPTKQQEAKYGETKIVSQLHGLAEFIPASIAAESTGGATFFLNGFGSGLDEVDKMKKSGVEFNNGSDEVYAMGRGVVDYFLMSRLNSHTLFSKLPKPLRDNVVKKLSMEAIGDIAKQGEKATAESILSAFKEKALGFDTKLKQFGVDYLKSYAHTAVDLTALSAANYALGKAANKISGNEIFTQTPEDLMNSVGKILTVEAPIFAGFGGIRSSGQLFKKSPYRSEVIESLYKDATPENVDAIKQDLAAHLQERGLNEQEIQNSVDFVDKLSEVTRTLPKTLSKEKFSEGVDLIIGRQELKDQLGEIKSSKESLDESIRSIPTKDEELVQAKLEQSNDKLQELVTGKKYKYKEDTEKGTYTKQLGDAKPEEISKDRFELEQVEKEFKTEDKVTETTPKETVVEESVLEEVKPEISSEKTTDTNNTVKSKPIIEPPKPISEMNSDEMSSYATDVKKALRKQDMEFANKTEQEKEQGGYYDVLDNFDDLRAISTRLNYIENSENATDLINSAKSFLSNMKKNPDEYDKALLNATIKKADELNLSTEELIKGVVKSVGEQYKDKTDAEDMMSKMFEKLQPKEVETNANKLINEQGTTVKETKVEAQPIIEPTKTEKISNEEDTKVVEPVNDFKSNLESKGFKKEGANYNKDGVTFTIEDNKVYEVNNGIPLKYDAFSNENSAIIELIENNDAKKGVASKLLDEVIDSANDSGKVLQLYPKKIKDGLSNSELTDWYKRKGFELRDDGIMVKNPINKTESNKPIEVPISKLQTAKEKLAEKRKILNDLKVNLSISADSKQKAKALYEYHKALVDVAKEYINEGIKNVEDFAKELGEKVSKTIKDAWDEANGIKKLKESDFIKQAPEKTVEEKIGFTKKDVEQLRNELGEEQYQAEVKKRSQLEAEVKQMLENGYDLKGLVKRTIDGEIPKNDKEVEALRQYYGFLTDAINKNPTPENIKERDDFLNAIDVAKTNTGRTVQAWNGFTAVKDDLADFLAEESKYADLSQKEITELTEKYKKAEEAKAKLQEQIDRLTAEVNDKKAIEAYAKLKRRQSREQARGEVKQAEREFRKNRIEAFRNELRKIRNQTNAVIFPMQRELIAAAPLVRDLATSYAREGISDLKIVLKGIYEELKNDIPNLTENDVRDILAGQYPNPKNTKNAKLAEIVDLQRQAKLELEIENLKNGIAKEKSPVARKKKSDRVTELEREVKLLKQQHPELTYPEKLEDRKRFYKNQIEKIKDEIKRGDFDPIVEPVKIVLDKEALKLKDEWQRFKEETRERREKREDEARSKTKKALDALSQLADLPRLVQTSIDVSIPLRQGIRIMLNPRTAGIGGKAYKEMIRSIFNPEGKGIKKFEFSEKNYQRMMFDLEHNPRYLEAKDDGIVFTEIGSKNNDFRDENHRANFLYNIPYLSAPLKASERAAAAWTNYARMELYLKGVRALEAEGKTRLNNKKAYEQMAARVLTDTGRGKIPLFPEQSRSEGERNFKRALGTVLYGPRLVSSVIRRLNPLYYFGIRYNLKGDRVDSTVRAEAAKDLVGYISAQVALALIANQMGYKVSLNPDDSDFLKLRKGKEVIDATGGESTAARTAFRLVNAVIKRADPTVNKQDADAYSQFMWSSVTNFWRNKLSPTYSYGVNAISGKNSIGEDFNPYDILKVYPMYTDDIVKAIQEDRVMQLGYVIPIGLSGLGYMQYEKDIRKADINDYMTEKDSGLKSFLKANKITVEGNINQEIYNDKTGTMMAMSQEESDKFEKKWSEEVINGLKERMADIMEIKKKGLPEDKERKKIKQIISSVKTDATVNAQRYLTGVAKRDLSFKVGEKTYELTSSQAQSMVKYINEFKNSQDYKDLKSLYEANNKDLKLSGEKLYNVDKELQKEAVAYAKNKIIMDNTDEKTGEIKLTEKE